MDGVVAMNSPAETRQVKVARRSCGIALFLDQGVVPDKHGSDESFVG
jgi:hypothetical protein